MSVFRSVHTFAYEGQYMFKGWKKGLKLSYVVHFNVILFVLYGIAEFIKKQIYVHMWHKHIEVDMYRDLLLRLTPY